MTVMRRCLSLLLALMLLTTLAPAPVRAAAGQPIGLTLDGQALTMDVPPVIIQGRTLVPLRAIMEALGADVQWDPATRTVTALQSGHTIKLQIDNTKATQDGKEVALDVPAQLVSGRTMVPVRFVVEATGGEVDWDGQAGTVIMAVYDEALKGRLRVAKANRDLPDQAPAYTAAAQKEGLKLDSPIRGRFAVDGTVHLQGQAGPDLEGGFITVNLWAPGSRHETILPVKQGQFSGDIPLADGQGWYGIDLLVPADKTADAGLYKAVSLDVKNVAARPRQGAYYTRAYPSAGLHLALPEAGQIAVDTTMPIAGTADAAVNGRFVWVQARKGNDTWDTYLPVKDGTVTGTAHLGSGPGLYWLKVMLQQAPKADFYDVLAEVPVINTSPATIPQPLLGILRSICQFRHAALKGLGC